jgi:MFS family permease
MTQRGMRGLVGVLSAQAGSLSANRLLAIAVPWFVLTTTGSVAKTGLIAFCQITPFVLVQILAGPLIDRVGPRRISIVGDVVCLAAAVTVPLLYGAHALPLWALMGLMAVMGAGEGPAVAAKAVFIPSVTRAARVPLETGTGLSAAVERTATVVGPAVAGFVVAAFGGARAFWVAAALVGLAIAVTVFALTDPPVDPKNGGEGYLGQLREGGAYLRREGLLRAIVTMVVVTNLLDQAFLGMLLPVWARESGYGASAVGLVVSVFGATSVVSALIAARYGTRLPRRTAYMVGYVLGGIPKFVAMALGLPLSMVLSVSAVGGLGSGFINPIIGAVMYERIPDELLGRVKTLTNSLAWSGIPFGGLVGAGLIATTGLSGALWIVGGCYLVAIVVPGLRPEWSQMRRPSPSAAEPPPALETGGVPGSRYAD